MHRLKHLKGGLHETFLEEGGGLKGPVESPEPV